MSSATPAPPQLLNALASLFKSVDSIYTIPAASASPSSSHAGSNGGFHFTPVDLALLDAMKTCAGVLLTRHQPRDLDPKKSSSSSSPSFLGANGGGERERNENENEKGNEKGKEKEGVTAWKKNRMSKLERLNHDVVELASCVNLLGSTWEVEMGRRSVADVAVDRRSSASNRPGAGLDATGSEEEWVDVLKEDVVGKGDNLTESKDDVPEEVGRFLPPLSLQRKDEILTTISDTASRIQTTVRYLHLSTRSTVQVTDFLGNTFDFRINLVAQLKARYDTGPFSAHMQEGRFQLLDFEDRKTVINLNSGRNDSLGDRKKALLVLVLSELPRVGEGCCPIPGCAGLAAEGSQICSNCGVWFDQVAPSRKEGSEGNDENISSIGRSSISAASAPAFVMQSGGQISTKTSLPIPRQPQADILQQLKYVKTTDLVTYPRLVGDAASYFACKKCRTHLALPTDICSRNFRGHHGPGILVSAVVNITRGATSERTMTTGQHQVYDVFCRQCGETLGWGYEGASELSERYKVDKFVLEVEMIVEEGGGLVVREGKGEEEEEEDSTKANRVG